MSDVKNMVKKVQSPRAVTKAKGAVKDHRKNPRMSANKRVNKLTNDAIIDAVVSKGDIVREVKPKPKAAKPIKKPLDKGVKRVVRATEEAEKQKPKERELLDTTTLITPLQVTPQEEMFLQEIHRGATQVEAYKLAYPKSIKWKHNTIKSKASALFNKEVVQARNNDMLKSLQVIEQKKTGWTRETSREVLENLILINMSELQRIDNAYMREREADLLALKACQKIIEDENSKKGQVEDAMKDIIKINSKMINRDKERRISAVHNDAVINAVRGINDMYGYNENNLDMAGVVVFKNKNKLED